MHRQTNVNQTARRGLASLRQAAGLAVALVATGALAATAAGGGAASSAASASRCSPKQVKLVTSIRTLSNPYQADWLSGAKLYGSSVGLPVKALVDNADSQKQLSLLKALVAGGGNCIVVNLDPNTDSDTLPDVKALTKAGAWVVTQWSLPAGVYPWKVSDHWITGIAPDGRIGGYEIAQQLFKAMGEKGNIVALQGILDLLPEKQRYAGLQKALETHPDIKLLDSQPANWDRQQAFNIVQTWLAKYPSKINGIWAANDNMALGALGALQAAGLAGKVPIVGTDAVPEALQDIAKKDNTIVATDASDAYWQGGIGLALGYLAATGKLNVNSLPHAKRLSYVKQFIITKENIANYLKPPKLAQLKPDWAQPFRRFTGAVTFPAY